MKSIILNLDSYIKTSKWEIITLNIINDVKEFFKKTTTYKNEIQECWECNKLIIILILDA